MDAHTAIETIARDHPLVRDRLKAIECVHEEAHRFPLDPFYEPKSLIDATRKTHRLIGLGPDTLTGWTRHIAYSTRVRMLALETAVLSELSQGRVLGAMVMIRSHMEAAGLAVLCLQKLTDAARDNRWEMLEVLIPKTYFGTSLKRQAKKDEIFDELLSFAEQDRLDASEGISSLDTFSDEATISFRRYYALLCDFVHANHRGVSDFVDILQQDQDGWVLKYNQEKSATTGYVEMGLEILFLSMRLGYTGAEMLRAASFPADTEGDWHYEPADDKEMRRIWSNILHAGSPP